MVVVQKEVLKGVLSSLESWSPKQLRHLTGASFPQIIYSLGAERTQSLHHGMTTDPPVVEIDTDFGQLCFEQGMSKPRPSWTTKQVGSFKWQRKWRTMLPLDLLKCF